MRTVWTIGHSTRPIEAFLALLAGQRIEALADVRRFPASRKHPQYNAEALEGALREAGIDYLPLTELGGRRPARPDSRNTAWRNASFRGYADYMETQEFALAFGKLLKSIEKQRTAIMCAEAVWWRCHRALLSDALKARGWTVCHILQEGACKEHPYTAAAVVVDGRLSYGPDQLDLAGLG
jgi:uncharacterized protein (DUF488 family)